MTTTSPPTPEVEEAAAEGKVKSVFDDIRETLQTPTVGSLFRRLAVYPWYLQVAWRNLKPNASTVYFHRVAGELKEYALSAMTGAPAPAFAPKNFGFSVNAFLDLDSKMLVAAAALAAGSNGQLPKLHLLAPEDMQIFAPRHPISHVDVGEAHEEQVAAREENPAPDHDAGSWEGESSIVQSASRWSDELSAAWSEIRGTWSDETLEQGARVLKRRAEIAVEALPYRMEISSTALRQSGLTEDQIDEVRGLVNAMLEELAGSLCRLAALASAGKGSPSTVAASR